MDDIGNSEPQWWVTEGDWSMMGRVLKQGPGTAAEQPREERGINNFFFHSVAKQGLKIVMEELKMF